MIEGSAEFDLRQLLAETRVSTLTLTVVPVLSPDESLDAAAAAMREVSHGSALVCDAGRLVGIITERDLLGHVSSGTDFEIALEDVMTLGPRTISSDDTLLDAVRLMDRGGYRRLPVLKENGQPAGIVDVKTVMNFIVDQVPNTVYNQASHELLTAKRAEGA
ncbi:MAG: CBS domain-containing protein [Planctomycetaceae bacterium]|nr:CBS domain-containing protein [Planctomycetaceae bacterium]